MSVDAVEIQRNTKVIIKEMRRLRKKRSSINRKYAPYVKNPLMGYIAVWGESSLRRLGQYGRPGFDHYRDLYFQDIKYRSKLKKIRDRLSILEDEYSKSITQLNDLVPAQIKGF